MTTWPNKSPEPTTVGACRSAIAVHATSRRWLWTLGIVRFSSLIVLLVCLCGCSSLPKHMTGQFNAPNGDFIVIEKNGALYWSPFAKTRSRQRFIGIASADKDDRERVRLTVPSTSPFLDSSFRFSADYSRLIVDWNSFDKEAAQGHSTEFERVSTK